MPQVVFNKHRPRRPRKELVTAARSNEADLLIDGIYRSGMQAFGARLDFEGDVLPFCQGAETITLISAEMHKYVFSAVFRRDETKTYSNIEPLYCTSTHRNYLIPLRHYHPLSGLSIRYKTSQNYRVSRVYLGRPTPAIAKYP